MTALPRSLQRPAAATIADAHALAELVLRQRSRMNGEDRALVEQLVVDALHAVAVAEYRRIAAGVRGVRRLRGCRGEQAGAHALAGAIAAYAGVVLDAAVIDWIAVEVLVRMRHAVGRGYAVWCRREARARRG